MLLESMLRKTMLPETLQNDRYQQTLNRLLAGTTISWIALAAVFWFYDLPISIAFAEPNSTWAIFLERHGEYPASYLLTTSILTLLVWGCLTVFDRIRGRSVNGLVSRFLPPTFRNFALATILMNVVCRLTIVVLTKRYWGRVRFKDLTPDYADFTAWHVINGVTGNYSFMSGHAASAWMVLALNVVTRHSPPIIRSGTLAISIGYGVLMAVSRVRIGAHYASDVLFASGICVTVFILTLKWLNRTNG